MAKKEISPIEVYNLLPKTNCGECGLESCMAFAVKLVNREARLEECPPLLTPEYKASYEKLWELLKPPVKEITIGVGGTAVKIGGKLVMYRHELTYHNPTAIAIDVTDEMPWEEVVRRVNAVNGFLYNYIGMDLTLDMIAIRSTSNDPEKFRAVVERVMDTTNLPFVLCSLNPKVMAAGLEVAHERRPLIYAATKENWVEMADLALKYECPLTIFAPNDLKLLRSLAKTMLEYGVEELVLDPGTFPEEGLSDTINNFTMIRRCACKEGDELLGFPIMGTPITAWTVEASRGAPKELLAWREAYVAAMLITRFADILIMHSLDGWALLPITILRTNLYTDPRKPVAVEAGLREFGSPDENSPVLLTSNYALTYYTVEADIKASGVDCYLLVADTEGIAVESAVAGRKLTADVVAETMKNTSIEQKVKHRYLIIPGRAARLKGEIEELTGWEIIVGPMDSSGIPAFLKEKWPPKKES